MTTNSSPYNADECLSMEQKQRAESSPQALGQLSSSEEKYRRLVEGISGDYVIYTQNSQGEITYVSPSVEHLLGYPPETIIGRNWRDFIGEQFRGREDADRVRKDIEAGKEFHQLVVEIEAADGTRRIAEIQERPLFDEQGHYVSMEGIAKDITEITRTSEELQRLKSELELRVAKRTAELKAANRHIQDSETRYRTVVEDQTEFICRWLPGGKLTFVNQAYCRYWEKAYEELIDASFYPHIYEEDRPAVERAIDSLSPSRPMSTIQHRVILPDGSIAWNEWTNRALYDDQGKLLQYQSVGKDITELKNAEDTIRAKETYLRHMSRLATMGELVSGIAHEVHQPLHAAKTFAEAARRHLQTGLPENVEMAIDCTNEISAEITRTAKIIRRLRDFTRSRPERFEHLDLNDVLNEAVELLAYETRKAQVSLDFRLAPQLPAIEGDQVQLIHVCTNILKNAFEAMEQLPPKERWVTISSAVDGDKVRLAFSDCGIGTPVDNLDRLFDAFYTTKTNEMGMGLSLCRSIAESHAGRIEVSHNQDQGMTFVLVLPILKKVHV